MPIKKILVATKFIDKTKPIDVVRIKRAKPGNFYQERFTGNLLSGTMENHMHLATKDDKNQSYTVLLANATTSPKASFKSESLGPGLILDPISSKSQYIVTDNPLMKFKTANSIQVVPQGKPFIDKKFNACYAAVNNSGLTEKSTEVYDLNKFKDNFYSNHAKKVFDTQKGLIAEAKVIAKTQAQVQAKVKAKAGEKNNIEDKLNKYKYKEDKTKVVHPGHKVKKKIKTPLDKEKEGQKKLFNQYKDLYTVIEPVGDIID